MNSKIRNDTRPIESPYGKLIKESNFTFRCTIQTARDKLEDEKASLVIEKEKYQTDELEVQAEA